MSVPVEWTKVPIEVWSTPEAWDFIYKNESQRDLRTALVKTGATPAMLNHLETDDWNEVYYCCQSIGDRGIMKQCVSFMKTLEEQQSPLSDGAGPSKTDAASAKPQKFHSDFPKLGRSSVLDFLFRVETFLKRNDVSADGVFGVVRQCIPDWAISALTDAQAELEGKPFSEISSKVRKRRSAL